MINTSDAAQRQHQQHNPSRNRSPRREPPTSTNVVLGLATWRSGVAPRWTGLLWIIGTLVFYVFGAFLGMATTGASLPTQPAGALLLAISSGWIAWAAIRSRSRQGSTAADRPTDRTSPSSREV